MGVVQLEGERSLSGEGKLDRRGKMDVLSWGFYVRE